jgi:hypothetical protein
MSQKLSALRSQLLQAQQQLAQLLQECLGREPLLTGSLYKLRRKCGKPNCHCTRGELHESTVLSYRGQGRARNVSPSPERIESLQTMTNSYRRCRQARAKLVRWQRHLLTLVDTLEATRVQQGEAEFRKWNESPLMKRPRRQRS